MLAIKTKKGTVNVSVDAKTKRLVYSLPSGFTSDNLKKLKVDFSEEIKAYLINSKKSSIVHEEEPVKTEPIKEADLFASAIENLKSGEIVEFSEEKSFRRFLQAFNLGLYMFIYGNSNGVLLKNTFRRSLS